MCDLPNMVEKEATEGLYIDIFVAMVSLQAAEFCRILATGNGRFRKFICIAVYYKQLGVVGAP